MFFFLSERVNANFSYQKCDRIIKFANQLSISEENILRKRVFGKRSKLS